MIDFSFAELKRFVTYTSVGVGTFSLDMALLYALVEYVHIDYRIATGVAFFIAVSMNYFLARILAFSSTSRGLLAGYILFLGVVATTATLTVGLMWLLVSYGGVYYLYARVGVAGLVGVLNYTMNTLLVFKTRAQ
jgi:putative flippase GtrA